MSVRAKIRPENGLHWVGIWLEERKGEGMGRGGMIEGRDGEEGGGIIGGRGGGKMGRGGGWNDWGGGREEEVE